MGLEAAMRSIHIFPLDSHTGRSTAVQLDGSKLQINRIHIPPNGKCEPSSDHGLVVFASSNEFLEVIGDSWR